MLQPHHRAIIFDCDGTLADSMPAHWIAWHQTLKHHGLDQYLPHERFMALGGVPAHRIFEMIAEEAGVVLDPQALAVQKYEAYFDAAHLIQPIAPTVTLARRTRGRLPMAVATGSTRKGVTHTLAAIGMGDFFDTVICADDVSHPKPHPETYLKAAETLGVAPSGCLAFEDTEVGMRSARDAGMDVIDVNDLLAQPRSAV